MGIPRVRYAYNVIMAVITLRAVTAHRHAGHTFREVTPRY